MKSSFTCWLSLSKASTERLSMKQVSRVNAMDAPLKENFHQLQLKKTEGRVWGSGRLRGCN